MRIFFVPIAPAWACLGGRSASTATMDRRLDRHRRWFINHPFNAAVSTQRPHTVGFFLLWIEGILMPSAPEEPNLPEFRLRIDVGFDGHFTPTRRCAMLPARYNNDFPIPANERRCKMSIQNRSSRLLGIPFAAWLLAPPTGGDTDSQ